MRMVGVVVGWVRLPALLRACRSVVGVLLPVRRVIFLSGRPICERQELCQNFAAPMPLLQDNGCAGGSQQNRRPLADFLNFDTSQYAEAVALKTNSVCESDNVWRWESPSSPEAAQTPRSLVPAACFPPRHSTAFSSHSERARPGSWCGEPSGHGITDLVASLKSLAMPAPVTRTSRAPVTSHNYHTRVSCEFLVESPWTLEGARSQETEDNRLLSRRASFCGVVSAGGGGAALHWSGTLPARGQDARGGWSPKVFLGGLPWDISEQALLHALRHFQPVRVEWPGREASSAPRGFAYVTLESERRVRALLAAARKDGSDWYFRVSSRNLRTKEVQVIPWAVCDSNWVCGAGAVEGGGAEGCVRLEPTRTVFVGALHGMLSASALATIMNDLFSGVVYAGIDTDKNKYPIGSGRVTFNNVRSYLRAISAAFIDVRTDKFSKKIQVDPYLEDSMCSVCNLQQGPYFCREPVCFRYFCRSCWAWQHSTEEHKALMRSSKSTQLGAPTVIPLRSSLNGGDGVGSVG